MLRCLAAMGLVLMLAAGIAGIAEAQSRIATPSLGDQGAVGGPPASSAPLIGGRPGPSVGRSQPRLLTRPTPNAGPFAVGDVGGPIPLPARGVPVIRPRRPGDEEPPSPEEGPPDGLTLPEAVGLLLQNNLELKARCSEISQANADVLTSSLRTNPILFADGQQVPYGNYSSKVSGGPVQYDINVVYPLDVSHKRTARVRSAVLARRIVEAAYRDAVRLTIDNLYTAYVDALAAQVNFERATGKRARDALSSIPVDEPASALRAAQRPLALLLDIPPAELAGRRLRGRIAFKHGDESPLPPAPDLVRIAMERRPDLEAQRLAVHLADANIRAVMANRLDDVLLLYQPYTFHDGRPFGLQNSLAWALGVTVPLPIYNRQQGNLRKARLIADQARVRLAAMEKAVAAEAQAAVLEHETSHLAYERAWNDVRQFDAGYRFRIVEANDLRGDPLLKEKIRMMEAQINDLREDAGYDKLKKVSDALVRHRRSMLHLNTVTAACLME